MLERAALHGVDRWPTSQRGEGESHTHFGQPVGGAHRLAAESATLEAVDEAVDGQRADRLRAVDRQSPRGQIEALELFVTYPIDTALVGEVRARRQGARVGRDRLQPDGRPGQELKRREECQGEPEEQTGVPGADQAHVVIEGKPAHEHVIRAHLDRVTEGPDVGQDLSVGQHDALRITGTARGVLDESRVVRTDPGERAWSPSRLARAPRTREPCAMR